MSTVPPRASSYSSAATSLVQPVFATESFLTKLGSSVFPWKSPELAPQTPPRSVAFRPGFRSSSVSATVSPADNAISPNSSIKSPETGRRCTAAYRHGRVLASSPQRAFLRTLSNDQTRAFSLESPRSCSFASPASTSSSSASSVASSGCSIAPTIPFFPRTSLADSSQWVSRVHPSTFMDVFAPRIRTLFDSMLSSPSSTSSSPPRNQPLHHQRQSVSEEHSQGRMRPHEQVAEAVRAAPTEMDDAYELRRSRIRRRAVISEMLFDVREVTEDEASAISSSTLSSPGSVSALAVVSSSCSAPPQAERPHFLTTHPNNAEAEMEDESDMPTPKPDQHPSTFAVPSTPAVSPPSAALTNTSDICIGPQLGSPIAFDAVEETAKARTAGSATASGNDADADDGCEGDGNTASLMQMSASKRKRHTRLRDHMPINDKRNRNHRLGLYLLDTPSEAASTPGSVSHKQRRPQQTILTGMYTSVRNSNCSLSSPDERPINSIDRDARLQRHQQPAVSHQVKSRSHADVKRVATDYGKLDKKQLIHDLERATKSAEEESDIPRRRYGAKPSRTTVSIGASSGAKLAALCSPDCTARLPTAMLTSSPQSIPRSQSDSSSLFGDVSDTGEIGGDTPRQHKQKRSRDWQRPQQHAHAKDHLHDHGDMLREASCSTSDLRKSKAQLKRAAELLQLQRSLSQCSLSAAREDTAADASNAAHDETVVDQLTQSCAALSMFGRSPTRYAQAIPRRKTSLAALEIGRRADTASAKVQKPEIQPFKSKRDSTFTVEVPICGTKSKGRKRKHVDEHATAVLAAKNKLSLMDQRLDLATSSESPASRYVPPQFSFEDMRVLTIGLLQQQQQHSFDGGSRNQDESIGRNDIPSGRQWHSTPHLLPSVTKPLKPSRSFLNLLHLTVGKSLSMDASDSEGESDASAGATAADDPSLGMSISQPELLESTAAFDKMQLRRLSQMLLNLQTYRSPPSTPRTPSDINDHSDSASDVSVDSYGEPTPRSAVASVPAKSSISPDWIPELKRAFWHDMDRNMEERMEQAQMRSRTCTAGTEAEHVAARGYATPPPRLSSRFGASMPDRDISTIPFPSRPSFSVDSHSMSSSEPSEPDSPLTLSQSIICELEDGTLSRPVSSVVDPGPSPMSILRVDGDAAGALDWMLPFLAEMREGISHDQKDTATKGAAGGNHVNNGSAGIKQLDAPFVPTMLSPSTIGRRLRCTSREIKLAAMQPSPTGSSLTHYSYAGSSVASGSASDLGRGSSISERSGSSSHRSARSSSGGRRLGALALSGRDREGCGTGDNDRDVVRDEERRRLQVSPWRSDARRNAVIALTSSDSGSLDGWLGWAMKNEQDALAV
ncbi:hypothetical protein K437DRAFT_136647 [Tilletiaria anomala UBC 951]|uniref:Uncharacterized protein n=1 Tax=Tilletiaria anomala (strain ATCC 24038 / CBS 436.72 / UBC 951) TaxID=1037660 RepID=A0A066VW90_TILAU|nr:uncharacterized protein K437DRAFT_136647 [Tilletiaria anomala UBC 951]KDN44558.1 hypothetical protein K437DRAFT_136647 [Tilletiaria anomala UBC 951]